MSAINRRTALVTLASALATPMWVRASSSSYQSELTGWPIELRGKDYVLDQTVIEDYPHGTGERFYFSRLDGSGHAEISFFDDTDSPATTIEVLLAEFKVRTSHTEVLEQGADASTTYVLSYFLTPQASGYYYIEVVQDVVGNVDMLQGFYGAASDFITQLAVASSDLDVNGTALLGAPVIDLAAIISVHQQELAQIAATPVVERIPFRLYPAELSVTSPVVVYDHYTSDTLEAIYFHSSSGKANGLVGFIQDDGPTATDVIKVVVGNQPQGEAPPEELRLDVIDDSSAIGLYRVPASAAEMAMLIRVTRADAGFWRIESIAAPPDSMMDECAEITAGTQIDGIPLFDRVDFVEILQPLSSS